MTSTATRWNDTAALKASAIRACWIRPGTMGGEYLLPDLFEMTGAMMYSLIQNHAFIDGNKRVGVASALVFLSINGVQIRQNDDGLYQLAIAVATGVAERGQIAAYFRASVDRGEDT